MEDFLGDLLKRIEASGATFSQQAYTVVSDELMPVLRIMFVVYVAWYGLQLVMGTARLGVGEIIGRVVRMMIVLALVGSWGNFDTLFYQWLNDTPENLGRAILAASGTGISQPTNGMSQIWKTASTAASALAEQSGYFSILPSMSGVLIMIGAGIFIAIALAILILAKVMLWVLIGTAPVFIACVLFERTRGYGTGWFNQVLTYALIPLFIYVIAAFLIAAINPELSKIDTASGTRTLTLADTAAFLLLCTAGAFVMLYVQSIAQGIAGGVAAGLGNAGLRMSNLVGIGIPLSTGRAAVRGVTQATRAGRSLQSLWKNADSGNGGEPAVKSAMQDKISRNGSSS